MNNTEEYCQLISTRGIAKICDIYPIWKNNIPIFDSFNINNNIGSIIYLHFDMVEPFIINILNRIKNPFILVSGNSDHNVPEDFPHANILLNSPKLMGWFSQNVLKNIPKLYQIPIGLDYHTLANNIGNHEWSDEILPIEPLKQEESLIKIKNNIKSIKELNPLVCTNFHYNINGPNRRFKYRSDLYNCLKNNQNIIWLPKQTREQFWITLNHIPFVICPFGNGQDTHRTWEVLCLGRIPIVQESYLNNLFEQLPVIIVNDWNQLTKNFLQDKFKEIITGFEINKYNMEKITLKYWKEKIYSIRNELLTSYLIKEN